MAKRRHKKRTHKKISEEELARIPRSMVLRLGSSLKNHSLSQLVKDFRNVMQPHTAINLRESKSNKLKDFVVMAGPLGVSDLFVFNQSEETGNISLRVGKMPRGPTLQFRINNYSLIRDVCKVLKRPKSVGRDAPEFLNPPLLVMNGFLNKTNEIDNHEKLLITMFQNFFPPINPQLTKVSSIKRVLMINKSSETDEINLRHYAIDTKLVEGNRGVKKLINVHQNSKKSLPNLSSTSDISEVLLDPYSVGGLTSDSEIEEDAIVEVKSDSTTSVKKPSSLDEEKMSTKKKAIKLTEIGPRINMTLMKIEEGIVGSSKTIYHRNVSKSKEELEGLEERHHLRETLKKERRAKQQENVKAKFDKKKAKNERKKAALKKEAAGDNSDSDSYNSLDSDEEKKEYELNPEDYENDSDLYSDVEV